MEYGLIGYPLGHSFSKIVHNALMDYEYEPYQLEEKDFESFMRKKDFKGINVTIPYKKSVIPFLDYVDPSVKEIGACNTIVNHDGYLFGYNTDYLGFIGMLDYANIELKNKKVAILGTGGASNAIKYVCKVLEAKETLIVSRNKKDGAITYDEFINNYNDVEVIINTTPVGMNPHNDETPISLDSFHKLYAVVDIIYNPLRPSLVVEANKRGIKTIGGLYMLVAQAVYAMEHFTDQILDKEVIAAFYERMVKDKENIVLIGMPSSGKSTIGKMISNKLNREFYDIDDEIIKTIKMPIKEYFSKYGEEAFRKIETSVIKELSKKNSVVISTGGGSILKEENVDSLKQNGKLYFLERDLDKLITTDDRPLSSRRSDLEKLYNIRHELYLKACDEVIDDNRSVMEVSESIVGGRK